MTHEVKCWKTYFKLIEDGSKTFDLRKNDRNYQAGDDIMLCEYNANIQTHTGRTLAQDRSRGSARR
jgi:hypothetical protein